MKGGCGFLGAVAVLAILAPAAGGADFQWWGAGTGGNTATDPANPFTLWDRASNWIEGSVPGSEDTAYLPLTNAGYANAQTRDVGYLYVDGTSMLGALHVRDGVDFGVNNDLYVGYNYLGRAVQSGGTHTVGAWLWLGYNSDANGTYAISGGSLSTGVTVVGYYGKAGFTQSGGTHTSGYLYVGNYGTQPEIPKYTLSAGTLQVSGHEYVGRGKGAFEQTGGSHTVNYDLTVGHDGPGTYLLAGGSLRVMRNEHIAPYDTGAFSQSGLSTHTIDGSLYVGSSNWGRPGAYSLSSGELRVKQNEYVGSGTSAGTFEQSGGTHTVDATLYLGRDEYSTGAYVLSGGSLQVVQSEYLGYEGAGTFTQTAGTHTVGSPFYVGYQATGAGTYNLRGGTLTASGVMSLGSGAGGSGTLNFSGGAMTVTNLLVGTATGNGALNLEGPVTARVQGTLALGAKATFTAVTGAKVRLTSPTSMFRNESTDPSALSGLRNLLAIFEGGTSDWATFEPAGRDMGAVRTAYQGNFALGALILGGANPGKVQLWDIIDNQPGWVGTEALYVENLLVRQGSVLDLNGLKLYYLTKVIESGASVVGGSPIAVPVLAGDANMDGNVDVGDLGILGANYGYADRTWTKGDFTGDCVVDVGDLGVLGANYGVVGGQASFVPEPGSMAILAIGLAGLLARRARG